MNYSQSDKRQEQSKKRYKRFLTWLRKPQTLRLLFQIGPVIFKILKWLIDLWQD